jgi:hypothetical protein
MGFTMKSVVVLSGFSAVLLDEDELPHPEIVRASVAAMAKGRNVIAPAYESPCVEALQA